MPRRKPEPAASSHLRRRIAGVAARLMAEEGVSDYGAAKRKAARRLGAGEGEALPSNEEVEVELRAWQSLFQEDEQRERIRELRATALDLMRVLDEFHPCLTGGALDGTAGRYAAIELELFADSSKDVEIALLSKGISYDIEDNRRPEADTRLSLEWQGLPVAITIYAPGARRQPAKKSRGGRSHPRARADEVAAMLASDAG